MNTERDSSFRELLGFFDAQDPGNVLPRPIRTEGSNFVVDDFICSTGRQIFPFVPQQRQKFMKRIALDPGHIGGDYAKEERRWFEVAGQGISEAELNGRVCRRLEWLLLKDGYEVLLTRRTESPALPGASGPFASFYPDELRYRAGTINAFRPSLTLSVHHNASDFAPGRARVNGVMSFIFGFPLAGETDGEEPMVDLLTKAGDGSFPLSLACAEKFTKALASSFGLPILTTAESSFSPDLCAKFSMVRPGIYLRNLFILRKVVGPVVLCEGPFMDDPEEARILLASLGAKRKNSPDEQGRIEEYALALFAAISDLSNLFV